MQIIDCFMYFDEDLMLEVRLNTLFEHVDQFAICFFLSVLCRTVSPVCRNERQGKIR